MSAVVIIQARLGSTRFPEKILADIEGKPMIQRVVERVMRAGLPMIVACPAEDHARLAMLGLPVPVFGGAREDVLLRYVDVAPSMAATIVRVTGDCPCVDPEIFSAMARHWPPDLLRPGFVTRFGTPLGFVEYVHNLGESTDGTDIEYFTVEALRRAHAEATSPYDREHVTPWMMRNLHSARYAVPGPAVKLSVDTPDDLERVRHVYRTIGHDRFTWAEAVAVATADTVAP